MRHLIIGAGPAGLTAGLLLAEKGEEVVLLEQERQVGGISKTVKYKNYRFDIGGHRFFTKASQVMDLWKRTMPQDFMEVSRVSRIYYEGKFYNYPLEPVNALANLGPFRSFFAFLNYLKVRLSPTEPEKNLRDVYTNSFGSYLYKTFFGDYSTRLWGIPPEQMAPDWGKARVGKLSLFNAVKDAFFPKSAAVKSLIKKFNYPKLGPGQMWEAFAREIKQKNGQIITNSKVEKINWKNKRILSVETRNKKIYKFDQIISSMPIKDLVLSLSPAPTDKVLKAAENLKYRDYILVALVIQKKNIFPDQWIYIQDPGFANVRIQNVNNWSSFMVGDKNRTVLGMEYVTSEEDELWQKKDSQLIDLAKEEVVRLGFAKKEQVVDAKVVREKKVYPVYDLNYKKYLETVKEFLGEFKNLTLIGRNGMHKYNNMDHSMLTAIFAVDNIFGAKHNLWSVNADQEYHERKAVK